MKMCNEVRTEACDAVIMAGECLLLQCNTRISCVPKEEMHLGGSLSNDAHATLHPPTLVTLERSKGCQDHRHHDRHERRTSAVYSKPCRSANAIAASLEVNSSDERPTLS